MIDELQQPHSLEIERYLLSSALKYSEFSTIYDNRVDADTFYSHIHREIFKAMLEIKKSGAEPELVNTTDRLRLNGRLEEIGGEVFIAELYSGTIATSANLEDWIKLHLQYHAKRLMINSCSETMHQCYSGEQSALELFNEHRSNLKDVELFSCGMAQKSTVDKLSEFVNYLQELQAGTGGYIIPFGINGLDELIQLQLKQMFVLGGLSGTGKTRFILCDAIGKAKKNVASAIFSFENPANIIISGIVSIIAKIPMFVMTQKNKLTQGQMSRITDAMKFLKDNSHLINIFGKGDYVHSVSGISAETRRIQDNTGGRLKIAYIDYIQNMKADKRQSRVEQIESCISGISDMGAEFNIATVPLSQLNRDKDRDKSGRRPILADMKGSGEIENAADYVVFLHNSNKAAKGQIELDIYTEKVRGTNIFDKKIMFDTYTGEMSGIVRQSPESRYSSVDYPNIHNKCGKNE